MWKSKWLEKQNEATIHWLTKQPAWHTWELIIVGLCGVLIGVVMAKACMYLLG